MNKRFTQTLTVFICCSVLLPGVTFASQNGLVISEFRIGTASDSYDEYVVIKNTGAEDQKLDGYTFSKKASTGTASTIYTFSKTANYILESGKEVTLANKNGYTGTRDHFDYSSSIAANNTLVLKDSSGKIIDEVGYGDAVEYEGTPIPVVSPDDIWLRTDDKDSDNNEQDFANKNAPKPVALDQNANNLIISEVLPNPTDGTEWIEIYNPTNQMVNLSGLKLCDLLGKVHCFSFNVNESISPFSYKTFDQSSTRITLNNDGDAAELVDFNGNVINSTEQYTDSATGESFSFFGSTWKWTKVATPGEPNIFESTLDAEKVIAPKTQTKTSKTKATSAVVDENVGSQEVASEVKSAEVIAKPDNQVAKTESAKIGRKEIGIGAIVLAFVLLLGYTISEYREKIYEFYHKISRRNK